MPSYIRAVFVPVILIALAVILGAAWLFQVYEPNILNLFKEEKPVIVVGKTPMRVELAETSEAREQGLSRRSDLPAAEGMLFIFPDETYHGIWMKDMRIPIDVVWINSSFTIVDIKRNLRPDSFPSIFEPSRPARFVLETNANFTESFGIRVGDKVEIPDYLLPEDLRSR